MDLYELYELGLKLKYGVPIDKGIKAEDVIKNHGFFELAKEIKDMPTVNFDLKCLSPIVEKNLNEMALDKAVKILSDYGYCTHYPGYTCDKGFSRPGVCENCIKKYLIEQAKGPG